MSQNVQAIPFAGSMVRGYRHVCAFFSSPHEEYETLLPFVLDGLGRGERAFHVLPGKYREEHLEQLRNAGVDIDILRTHPVAIIGGVLHENPFFVRPDEFLHQLLRRGGEQPKPYRR